MAKTPVAPVGARGCQSWAHHWLSGSRLASDKKQPVLAPIHGIQGTSETLLNHSQRDAVGKLLPSAKTRWELRSFQSLISKFKRRQRKPLNHRIPQDIESQGQIPIPKSTRMTTPTSPTLLTYLIIPSSRKTQGGAWWLLSQWPNALLWQHGQQIPVLAIH